jgi:hypothetical protein
MKSTFLSKAKGGGRGNGQPQSEYCQTIPQSDHDCSLQSVFLMPPMTESGHSPMGGHQ